MHKKIFSWLGKEFIELSGEAKPDASGALEAREVFQRFDAELRNHGLSLDNTVRSRLWGRDRESRDAGSHVRVKVLSGRARSASSSYISPSHFDSPARIALDLLAMRPATVASAKHVVEYDPPIVPIRFLVYEGFVALSGVTAVLPNLEEQFADIVPRIAGSLKDAGSSWEKAERVSFYLHRSQTVERVKELFSRQVKVLIPQVEYVLVDGYSAPDKLCEIEVTATV
jgi:enamine deaminase RidA (YjgF/YER057c/UK114 family)